ncbi:BspA family leucine-rich repeat surface protein [Mycoplasma cottewii]|uniref:BspA family leucine-rich repeat surface protein n=1 Tax=Mycoplasma cottewii TaxID=51364 RepID=A0ABY5TYV4_9MOLU|nr:BspA family leucine-rich repeat surface protein [Mycoplasma cottewii]UWD35380.1 BspA family leucine-rich repeat surface protein [Mycoplasma cottewii]
MPETVKEVPEKLPWQINSLEEAFKWNKNKEIKNLEKWDLRFVKNINLMFNEAHLFNQNINNWDTSNIVSMNGVFYNAWYFNQPIKNWNVSNVISMKKMFRLAKSFNQPINNWNVSNVKDMEQLFSFAESFNQELSNWDVSNVTNMMLIFCEAHSFNKDVSSWCFSKELRSLAHMFAGAESFNNDGVPFISRLIKKSNGETVKSWDISNITNMDGMFERTKSFCQDISNWDLRRVSTKFFVTEGSGNWFNPNWSKNIPKSVRNRYYDGAIWD